MEVIYANDHVVANTLDRSLEETQEESIIRPVRLVASRGELAVAIRELDLASNFENMFPSIGVGLEHGELLSLCSFTIGSDYPI